MPSRIAGTATWTEAHTLQLNMRFVEAIFGDSVTCMFEGDKLKVMFLNSVVAADPKKVEMRKRGTRGLKPTETTSWSPEEMLWKGARRTRVLSSPSSRSPGRR